MDPKYEATIVNRETGEQVPDEEPVFIIRAQDVFSGPALRAYASLLEKRKPDDAEKIRLYADEMDAWPDKKVAD